MTTTAIRTGAVMPPGPPQPTDVWPHTFGLVTTPPLVDRHGGLEAEQRGEWEERHD